MINPRLPNHILALFALSVLPACDSSTLSKDTNAAPETRVFSDAKKAAAKTLSIGVSQTIDTMRDPTTKASICSRSIGTLTQILSESNALTDIQRNAIEQARAFYQRQIPKGSDIQRSDGTAGDREDDLRVAEIDPGQDARIALACLRDLEEQQ